MSAASVAATAGCSPASAAARDVGARDREREAPAVDEPERRARSRIACSSAATPSGVFAPASRTSNASASRAADVGRGRHLDQTVDRLDAELVVDELDDERHDRARPRRPRSPASRSSLR